MGMSESHDGEAGDATHTGQETAERVTLASLRSQFTSASNPSWTKPSGLEHGSVKKSV